MSRHLMAKMRRTAAQPMNWQQGVVLPHTARDMAKYNRELAGRPYSLKYPDGNGWPEWKPEHVSTAMTAHGERLHALQVVHEHSMVNDEADGGSPWLWSLHTLEGDDPKNPDHWKHLNQYERNTPLPDEDDDDFDFDWNQNYPGEEAEWDYAGSQTGGQMGNWAIPDLPGDFSSGANGGHWGYSADRDKAQKAAETAWARYTGDNGSGLGDVDLGKIGPIVPEPGGQNPDDDYGDFSGLFGGGR